MTSQQRYLPFGGVRSDVGSIVETDYGYTGQRNLDSEIGLMDYKFRFYSATLGRFISPDSLVPNVTNPQSWNRFSYAINNPILYNDPDGHCGVLCVLVFISIPFLLSGDTARPSQPNPAIATIEQIKISSPTSADALVNMFTTDLLSGNTAQERFETILTATENAPYQHFEINFNDSGFKIEFQDSRQWAGSGNQVGHFLTASDLSYNFSDTPLQTSSLILITGHEMYSDNEVCCSTSKLAQGLVGTYGELKNSSTSLFLTGTDDAFNELLNMGPVWGRGSGNSLEDLRLSHQGWRFGQMMKNSYFSSRNDAANWLIKNIVQ